MSKYVIKFEDNPWYQDEGVGYYKCGEIPWWSAKKSDIKKLTPLDKELDDAYQKGLEEGKKRAKVQAHLDVCHDIERVAHGNYQKGLDDAWECARKIVTWPDRSLVNSDTFDLDPGENIFTKYSASRAIEKLKDYEEQQKADGIKVGDEVIWSDAETIIVTMVYVAGGFEWCDGISQDGRAFHVLADNVRKTGKHYDITSILEAMAK